MEKLINEDGMMLMAQPLTFEPDNEPDFHGQGTKEKPITEPELHFDTTKTNEDLLKYEMVKCPDHYHKYDKEVIDMMEQLWGPEAVINYCTLSAFKHRMSLGVRQDSNDITIQQDLKKEQWYLAKAKELQKKLNK